MAASRCVRCMQCLCWGFVLGRHGQFGESFLSDKQRDRKHPFSFPQCRQGNMRLGRDMLYSKEQIYTLRGGGWLRADVYAACSVCVGGLS